MPTPRRPRPHRVFIWIYTLALLVMGAAPARSGELPRRIVVGVIPFQSPTGFESLRSLAAGQVRSELMESPRYQLVEEEKIDIVLAEIAKGHRLDFSQGDAIQTGRLVAARYMAFGEVISVELHPPGSLFDCDLSAALRLVEVETGVIVFQKVTTIHGGRPDACLSQALAELTCELLKSATLAGTVIDAQAGGLVTVDLGARDGMRTGLKLAVLREGGVILHPATGRELRRPDQSCGEIVLDTVGEETSFAKPLKPKESNLRVGDRVLLPIAENCSKLGSTLRQAGTPLFKALLKKLK
jgi:hypothetical protein